MGLRGLTRPLTPQEILLLPPSELRQKFEKAEILTEDNFDAVDSLRKIIKNTDYNPLGFILHINPTLDCNFNCWYCYEKHKRGTRMDAGTLKATLAFIENQMRQKPELRNFQVAFFGGEPLLGFDAVIRPIVDKLEELGTRYNISTSIQLTTNGLLASERVIKYFAKHPATFQITLDGHRSYHNKVRNSGAKNGSYDIILHNIQELALNGSHVIVRINYTAENYISVPDIIADLLRFPPQIRTNIIVDFQRVWQDEGKGPMENIKRTVLSCASKLREAGYVVSTHFCHSTSAQSCYGDRLNYMLINYDGGVYLCTARDFTEENSAGALTADGTVVWKDDAKQRRMDAKFSKAICHECRIAPICGGGCCQRAIERIDTEECLYGYTEQDKDNIVTDRFEAIFMQ